MQAQECCDGGSLMSLMMKAAGSGTGKRLYSYLDALRWVTQAAKAIQYLHDSRPQVMHRDLKSENLLLTQRGRGGDVRVMDFGLTKLRSASPAPPPPLPSRDVCTPAKAVPRRRPAQVHRWSLAQAARITAGQVFVRGATRTMLRCAVLTARRRGALARRRARGCCGGTSPAAPAGQACCVLGVKRVLCAEMAAVGYTQAMRTDVYLMTGETGSYIYMAPEVVRSQAYNEKVRRRLLRLRAAR